MRGFIAEVAACEQPFSHLSLHTQIPLLQIGRPHVEGSIHVHANRRKEAVRRDTGQPRKGIAACVCLVWVRQTTRWICECDACSPERVTGIAHVEKHMGRVIKTTIRGTNGHLAIALRIKDYAQTWRKLSFVGEAR